jgi:hypothetical protein
MSSPAHLGEAPAIHAACEHNDWMLTQVLVALTKDELLEVASAAEHLAAVCRDKASWL